MLGWLWQGKDELWRDLLVSETSPQSITYRALTWKLMVFYVRVNSYFHLSSLRAMLCWCSVCVWVWECNDFHFVKVFFFFSPALSALFETTKTVFIKSSFESFMGWWIKVLSRLFYMRNAFGRRCRGAIWERERVLDKIRSKAWKCLLVAIAKCGNYNASWFARGKHLNFCDEIIASNVLGFLFKYFCFVLWWHCAHKNINSQSDFIRKSQNIDENSNILKNSNLENLKTFNYFAFLHYSLATF